MGDRADKRKNEFLRQTRKKGWREIKKKKWIKVKDKMKAIKR